MDFSGKIINNNYIIRENIYANPSFSLWEAQSIYSVKKFLILITESNSDKTVQVKIENFKNFCINNFSIQINNLNSIYEINYYENFLFIASEINDGLPLFKYINDSEKINFDNIKKIITDLTIALNELENKNLTHGFVNPKNIWITLENDKIKNVKLMNFGLKYLNEILKFKINDYDKIFRPSVERNKEGIFIIINFIDGV
jgi:serine/threonine protein kinase